MDDQILDSTQMKVIEKLPIAETLRALEIGQSVNFPKTQYDSLYARKKRLKNIDGIEIKIQYGKEAVTVTRIA